MNISPGQALLLIIKKIKHDKQLFNIVVTYYLNGFANPEDRDFFYQLLSDHHDALQIPGTEDFHTVDESDLSINNDNARRFFETKLGYLTIKKICNESTASSTYLDFLLTYIKDQLAKVDPEHYNISLLVEQDEIITEELLNQKNALQYYNFFKEFQAILLGLKNKSLCSVIDDGFTEEARNIIKSTVLLAFWSVRLAQSNRLAPYVPLDIYNEGIYRAENKGRILLTGKDYDKTQSLSLGLMRKYDRIPSDLRRTEISDYKEPSDQSTYDINAHWPKENFNRLVHPFSNSISGTMLCYLRAMAFLQDIALKNKQTPHGIILEHSINGSEERFVQHYRWITGSLIYFSGGHTLFEFQQTLAQSKVIQRFNAAHNLGVNLDLSHKSIAHLYDGDVIIAALNEAIQYNDTLLVNNLLLHELHEQTQKGPIIDEVHKENFDPCAVPNVKAPKSKEKPKPVKTKMTSSVEKNHSEASNATSKVTGLGSVSTARGERTAKKQLTRSRNKKDVDFDRKRSSSISTMSLFNDKPYGEQSRKRKKDKISDEPKSKRNKPLVQKTNTLSPKLRTWNDSSVIP